MLAALAFQDYDFASRSFGDWLRSVGEDDRHDVPLWRMSRDCALIFWQLEVPISARTYSALCLVMAGVAAFMIGRAEVVRDRLFLALLLGPLWMTAFGPATESNTYTLLGAVLPTICVTGGRWRWVAYCGAGLVLLPFVAMAFPGGARLDRFGVQPMGAVLLWTSLFFPKTASGENRFKNPTNNRGE